MLESVIYHYAYYDHYYYLTSSLHMAFTHPQSCYVLAAVPHESCDSYFLKTQVGSYAEGLHVETSMASMQISSWTYTGHACCLCELIPYRHKKECTCFWNLKHCIQESAQLGEKGAVANLDESYAEEKNHSAKLSAKCLVVYRMEISLRSGSETLSMQPWLMTWATC